jgi:hypothetical protein
MEVEKLEKRLLGGMSWVLGFFLSLFPPGVQAGAYYISVNPYPMELFASRQHTPCYSACCHIEETTKKRKLTERRPFPCVCVGFPLLF